MEFNTERFNDKSAQGVSMKKLKGVVTAVPTIFDCNEQLDLDNFGLLLSFLIDRGVNGLYPCGTTGEMIYLTMDERKKICEKAVEIRNSSERKVDLFMHTGAEKIGEIVELTNHAADAGADGAGIVTPWYFKLDDEAIYRFYVKVLSQVPSDYPIYVYNIPQLSGNDLMPEVIRRLKDRYDNIVGIKYSWSDFNRLKEYIGISGVDTLVGADVQMAESMLIGAVGTVSGLSSVYPEIFSEVYRLYTENRLKESVELEKKAYELGCIMKHGGNLSMFKEGLTYRGLAGGVVRSPLRNMTEEEKTAYLDKLGNWEARLGEYSGLLKES
jgi:dihydrodipicolinate synthase/N-acetylneuraminate lyase